MESLILEHPQLAPFVVSNVKSTGKIIGTGSFGKVEEVAIPGTVCVAKHIHSFLQEGRQHGQKLSPEFVKECKIMSNLRHPHIVQLLGVCVLHDSTDSVSTVPAILMEKMMTSLHDFLEPETNQPASLEPPPKPFIPLSLKRSILQNVASGLTYLHEQSPPIIHRDLSARNVLLNSGMVAKIADLGMARIIESMGKAASMTKAPGASLYMPPEALAACPGDVHRASKDRDKKATYDSSIDVFSFGVVSIFVLSQTFPEYLLAPTYWDGPRHIARTEYDRREDYMELIYQQLDEKHPLVTMIKECLDIPIKRPGIVHIMKVLKQGEEGKNTLQTLEMENKKFRETEEHYRVELTKAAERVKEKDGALGEMAKRVEKAEKRAATIQEHSKAQSQRINLLQNEAKEKDADAYKLQEKLKAMDGRILILEAEKEANDLNYEQYNKTMKSLRSEVRKLTLDNAGLTDQMKRCGGLQNESRELHTKLAKLKLQLDKEQNQLKKVTFEREELKSTLELVQAQAKIYEEDFKTERKDRTRAFAEREKEGERYREEIERLTKQLKGHKGNVDAVESVHMARQQELIKAMKELKKCQEEVQAKTSQVKQYKKQHDGLVSKVAQLEEENKLLDEQFCRARDQIDIQSKKLKKPNVSEAELSHMRAEIERLSKQADHYQRKSKKRKQKILELIAKQDEPKKIDKKKDKSHGISSPVTESDKILYQNLEEENQELRIKVQELKKCIEVLDDDVPVGLEEEEKRSPSHYEELFSPDEPTWSAVPKEQATAMSEKETGSERRSKSFSGNREQSKKANLSPSPPQPTSSPPDDSCLPAPIMVFTDDPSPKQPPLGHIPGNGGSGEGGLGLGYEQGVERRGSAPGWVSGANPQDIHKQQHQLYQYGYASLPGQPSPAPQSPPTPPPSSSANQRAPPTMGQGGREPSAAETDRMMREEKQRQGGDILIPGIDTAMHARVENDDIPVGLEEEEEKRSPSHYEELPSPDEPTWSAANVPKKQVAGHLDV